MPNSGSARLQEGPPQPASRHRQLDMHAPAQGGRDVRKGPEREVRDSSPQQVIHARLRHARAARGIRLGLGKH